MRKYRIFIADSTPSVRQYIRHALQEHMPAVEFEAANNGKNVKRRLESAQFDLVLYDRDMAMFKGDELLQWIRSHKRLKHLPVVLLSSDADESRFSNPEQYEADGYLIKPLLQDPLVQKVKEVLARARQKAAARNQRPVTGSLCDAAIAFGEDRRSGSLMRIDAEELFFCLEGAGPIPAILDTVTVVVKVSASQPALSLQGQVTAIEAVDPSSLDRRFQYRLTLAEAENAEGKKEQLEGFKALTSQSSGVSDARP